MARLNKVIALVGATGSGKTDLAIQLALHYHAVIVNLDSVQIYKELHIGSAKPSEQERAIVPHYLVDIASIYQPKNSFYIFQKSYELIQELKATTNIILTGGTGLYYKNLLWGMFQTPSFSEEYRKILRTKNSEELWQELLLQDPKSAEKLHPNDSLRVQRALEVKYSTGKSIIDLKIQQEYRPPAEFLMIGMDIPRNILYERINQRVFNMIKQGLAQEVENLWKKPQGFPQILNKIIGYKEWIPFFNKEISLEECVLQIQQNTRRYAKRQLTLFRHIPNIHWIQEITLQKCIHYIDVNTSSESNI